MSNIHNTIYSLTQRGRTPDCRTHIGIWVSISGCFQSKDAAPLTYFKGFAHLGRDESPVNVSPQL